MVPDMRHTAVSIPIMSITFITTMESAMLFLLITAMLPKEKPLALPAAEKAKSPMISGGIIEKPFITDVSIAATKIPKAMKISIDQSFPGGRLPRLVVTYLLS